MKLRNSSAGHRPNGDGVSGSLLFALRLQALCHGIWMQVDDEQMRLICGRQTIILGSQDVISVPLVVIEWDKLFARVPGLIRDGKTVLDFSKPRAARHAPAGSRAPAIGSPS